jgi:hypothetical protein
LKPKCKSYERNRNRKSENKKKKKKRKKKCMERLRGNISAQPEFRPTAHLEDFRTGTPFFSFPLLTCGPHVPDHITIVYLGPEISPETSPPDFSPPSLNPCHFIPAPRL